MQVSAPVASPSILTFEEDGHIYRLAGREIPSVTTIIREIYGDLVWPWRSEFALERGRRVHQAVHYYLLGDLDVKSLSEYIAGYVAAAIRFLTDTGFEVQRTEHRMYSAVYDVAGTLDLVGMLDRKSTLADFKTGEPGWATGVQTAAYTALWQEETGEVIRRRVGVQLSEDGSYKLINYASREDLPDFVAALRVHQRRRALAA